MANDALTNEMQGGQANELMGRMVELLGKLVHQHEAANSRSLDRIQPWAVVAEDPDPAARRRGLQELMGRLREEEQSQSELLGHIACAQMALLKDTQELFGALLGEVRSLREGLAISIPGGGLPSEPSDSMPS